MIIRIGVAHAQMRPHSPPSEAEGIFPLSHLNTVPPAADVKQNATCDWRHSPNTEDQSKLYILTTN